VTLLKDEGYSHILKKYKNSADFVEWYEGELARLAEQLRENLDAEKEEFYRQELEDFRRTFHKPVIYASWDWDSTVEDSMHQAGFANYDEQEAALEALRNKGYL